MGMAKVAVESQAEGIGRRSRGGPALIVAVVAGLLIWSGCKVWDLRRYRRAMAEIKQEIQAGRQGHAARKLAVLLAWKPDSDEASYLLGACEKARGQPEAASQAWKRVSSLSPFGARAIRGRMELLIERGRIADAEKLVMEAMSDPRIDASGSRLFLGLVYSLQGRVEDGERVIEACWNRLNEAGEGASELAILLVRLHIQLWRETAQLETVRSFLDQAARSAPDDDRCWLGKAKLAIRVGSYDEAARWLEACLRRRPDDVPVWRARLDWALATHRLADVRQALGHLPAAESSPAEVQRLTAWLAAERGDVGSERRALERLVAVGPADFNALDRLAAIAEKEGESDRAGEFRRKKAEVERLLTRYDTLYKRNQTMRDAVEMAGLADQLGQPFEAKVLRTIAIATDPERRRLGSNPPIGSRRDASTTPALKGTLADLLAGVLEVADPATH